MLAVIKERYLFALAAFVSLTIVLREFMKVYHLADTQTAVVLTGLLCGALMVIPRGGLRIPVVVGIFFGGIYHYFPLGQPFGWRWLDSFRQGASQLLRRGFAGELWPTPTLLAFLLIWAALILLADLMIIHRQIWFPYFSLISYLLVLSVFNSIDPVWQLLVIACLMLAAFGFRNSLSWRSSASLLVVAALLGTTAYLIPDSWVREPAVYQTAAIRERLNQLGVYQFIQEAGHSAGRTGFGEDDSQLGGPLSDDETLLFTALQGKGHYWRVDSKDWYTGLGWERSQRPDYVRIQETALRLSKEPPVPEKQQTSLITFQSPVAYLPQPYGTSEIQIIEGYEGFRYLTESARVDFLPDSPAAGQVNITWEEPAITPAALQGQLTVTTLKNKETYLQLPESLPQRVKNLAAELTKNEGDNYHKVKAIENYLSSNREFRYSKVDAATPSPEGDYVDQFLFETKVGYCDNFSTSMIVLLRTLGIPARWAKGFNTGDQVTAEGGQKSWQVRNKHAHSWPEVYFDGFGWVPFEPTPAFVNPDVPQTTAASSAAETPEQSASQGADQQTPSSETNNETSEETTSGTSESTTTTSDLATTGQGTTLWTRLLTGWGWLLLVVVVLLSGLLWFFRFELQLAVAMKRKDPLFAAYPLILQRCEALLPRAEGESLRHYAQRFESRFSESHGELLTLTAIYEGRLYGGQEMSRDEQGLLREVATIVVKLKKA